MRFPPSLLDDIRARLPVSVVVGRRVKLVKSGREWKGLSPFQQEKTPSFYVNDQKGFYHCFSSGKHGDIFRFVSETEGLSFPETVERLAAEAGVVLPKIAPEAEAQEQKRRDLYDVVELACKYFEAQLQKPGGAAARSYLEGRRIAERTQAEFRIGFAPESRDGLLAHLRSHGVSDRQILDAGLAIEPEDKGRALYDRFRNRVIIPIQDMKGRVVAFGGRVLDPDAKPKYLNSPETPLFKKGFLVFNGHRAREAAFKSGTVIATEGYLDAIAVWQAGLRHVVATLGTAFTEEQIATLWRFAPEPVICFDGDKAGVAAANRAIDRILPQLKTGYSFRFAFLPEGQDPDDLIRNRGLDAFVEATVRAVGLWDALWQRETAHADVATPDRQAMLERRLNDLTAQIADPLVRRRYELSARFRVNSFIWERVRLSIKQKGEGERVANRPTRELFLPSSQGIDIETILLGMCIHFPDLAERHRDTLTQLEFKGMFNSDGSVMPYKRFLDGLLRIVDLEESMTRSFAIFYKEFGFDFMESLDFFHGRELVGKKKWGYNLYIRFRTLNYNPDEEFIERYFYLLIMKLGFRSAQAELHNFEWTSNDESEEVLSEKIIAYRKYLDHQASSIDLIDMELQELAVDFEKSDRIDRSAAGRLLQRKRETQLAYEDSV